MNTGLNPTAAVLVIGNEILSGRTDDVNVGTIARRLTEYGIRLQEARVVPDTESEIILALNTLRTKYTYVFTTGGIGPTHDDITIAAVAKAFGVPVVRNARVEEFLRQTVGPRATEATFRMADYPESAEQIWHNEPAAPGCRIENVFVLAGQPRWMQVMLEAALPLLQAGPPIHTRSVDVWGLESMLAADLKAVQETYPAVEVGSYPYKLEGRAGTALVVRGQDLAAVDSAFSAVERLVDGLGLEKRAA